MRLARGPRPWSIRLFAALFLLAGSWQLVDRLTRPLMAQLVFEDRFPALSWTPEWVIVASFTEFTIALIPILWIYFLASGFARWFVVILGLVGLVPHSFDLYAILTSIEMRPSLLVSPLAVLTALALLFTPSAARWFRRSREVEHETFA